MTIDRMLPDMDGMAMTHSGNMASIRILSAKNRMNEGNKKLAASSATNMAATAHVKAATAASMLAASAN